ncbi:hypothetical protein ScPMuIL_012683 [Solemya velum]
MGAKMSFPVVRFPRERVVIVTGGNAGIGYETSKWIAMMGAKVIIACRSEERATKAIETMNTEFQEEKSKGRTDIVDYDQLCVEYMHVDLASLKSTKQFIDAFIATGQPLHVLICNAGVALMPQTYTDDGYELMFQVNYLSHFLIAAHFLPVMKMSGDDCRIINVSSLAESLANFDMETIQGKGASNFGRFDHYGRSKLYQIMQMYSMARRLEGCNVTIASLHPGTVDTEIVQNSNDLLLGRALFAFYKITGNLRTPFEGAKTSINAAVNPVLRGVSGVFYDTTRPATPSRKARNESNQEKIWQYTLDLLKDLLNDDIVSCLEGKS